MRLEINIFGFSEIECKDLFKPCGITLTESKGNCEGTASILLQKDWLCWTLTNIASTSTKKLGHSFASVSAVQSMKKIYI